MKRKAVASLSALFMLLVAGCRKEYTCRCTVSNSGGYSEFSVKGTRKKAEEKCSSYSDTNTSGTSTVCNLQ